MNGFTTKAKRFISESSRSFKSRSRNATMGDPEKNSSPFMIMCAWLIVLLPLGWGVVQSVVKSLPLFHASAPAAANPPVSPK